jgi:hypothetical protein
MAPDSSRCLARALAPYESAKQFGLLIQSDSDGPAGPAYSLSGLVAATDGFLKKNGSMGAAYVSIGGRLPPRSVSVLGQPSSIQPELTLHAPEQHIGAEAVREDVEILLVSAVFKHHGYISHIN